MLACKGEEKDIPTLCQQIEMKWKEQGAAVSIK